EVRQPQRVAGDEPRAVGPAVDTAALVEMAQDQVEDRVEVRLLARDLDAAPRELDRRLQELAPRQPSVRLVDGLEPAGRAGDRARRRADPEDLGRLAVAAEAD